MCLDMNMSACRYATTDLVTYIKVGYARIRGRAGGNGTGKQAARRRVDGGGDFSRGRSRGPLMARTAAAPDRELRGSRVSQPRVRGSVCWRRAVLHLPDAPAVHDPARQFFLGLRNGMECGAAGRDR